MHYIKPKDKIDSPTPEIRKKLESYIAAGLKNLSADELVNIAKKMGEYLKENGLKTTQIRKFLDSIRKIESQSDKGKKFNPDAVILLKPKLAYAAGRDWNRIKPLMEVLEPAITAGSKGYDDFKKLVALIEGIVAYHKYYGGQD
jgi:CRISPR-associated protein Csm2